MFEWIVKYRNNYRNRYRVEIQKGRLSFVVGSKFRAADGRVLIGSREDFSWLIIYMLSKLEGNQNFVT